MPVDISSVLSKYSPALVHLILEADQSPVDSCQDGMENREALPCHLPIISITVRILYVLAF
jgi:hypothetical protein